MRVLIFSAYFWPEEIGPAPYITEPARFLVRRGHDVEVWTGYPHYPAWRPSHTRTLTAHEERDGIVIRRRLHFIPRTQSTGRRALYEGSLTIGALTALAQARTPDVVLSVTPTLSGAVGGAAAAARFRVPYALLVHDLMGQAAEQSGVRGGKRVARLVRAIEVGIARRADRVGIIADDFRDYFCDAGVPDERIVRLRTWTLGSGPNATRADTRRRLGWSEDEFVVLHGGNMGHKQGLNNLIEAASILQGSGVRIVLAGDGNDRSSLECRARIEGLKNLQFLNPQPWGDYEAMLGAADLLVVNQRATVADMSLPSKLTSYFASGRPTIAAVAAGSSTAREIQRSRGGVHVAAGDARALAATVLELRDAPERRSKLGDNARRYAVAWLKPSAVLPAYEEFLAELCR